jgi:hypothetical protein
VILPDGFCTLQAGSDMAVKALALAIWKRINPDSAITVVFGNVVPPIDQSFARMLISGQSLKGRLPCLSHSIATISPAHASMAAQDGRSGRKA